MFVSAVQALSPRILLASWMSLGMMVTRLACMVHRLVSSNSPTKYASAASCRAIIAALWNLTLPHRGEVYYLAVTCNFPNQSLKGQLPNQKFHGFLVLPDLLQGNSSRPISVVLLHSAFWSFLAILLCQPGCCFRCALPPSSLRVPSSILPELFLPIVHWA